jgi:hypothetical protein
MNDKMSSPPTTEQFKQALLALRPVSPKHFAMLKAHFRAAERAMTATQLAEAAGYANYSAVNMQYGMFGKAIAEHLGLGAPMHKEDGEPVWTSVIAAGPPGETDSPHYVWTLRPELAAALTELPWGFVKRASAIDD